MKLTSIVVGASDPAEATANWGRALGLEGDESRRTRRAGETAIEFETPVAGQREGLLGIVIAVEDLEDAVQRLTSRGIAVLRVEDGSVALPESSAHGVRIRLAQQSGER